MMPDQPPPTPLERELKKLRQLPPGAATQELKRQALKREVEMRRHVYARRCGPGRTMSFTAAAREIWLFERILADGFQP